MIWSWVNVQSWGVLLVLIIVRQGPNLPAVGAGRGCLHNFSLVYHFSSFSLWETAQYKQKYCLKGPLNSKQPTNVFPRGYITLFITYGAMANDTTVIAINILCKCDHDF